MSMEDDMMTVGVTVDGSEGSWAAKANRVVVVLAVLVSFVREARAHRTTGCRVEEGPSER